MSGDAMTTPEEQKPWQLGYDLDFLKGLAQPFKERYKPFAHGAFGTPKERDIATAVSVGWYYPKDISSPTAAAIAHRLKTAGRHRDFTGAEVIIPYGSFYVSDLAWVDGGYRSAEALLVSLLTLCGNVWLELHEEDTDAKLLAESHGFTWQATKVSAGSTVTGLYVRTTKKPVGLGLARQTSRTYDPAELPGICCLQPDYITGVQQCTILSEVAQLEKWWASHYSSYNKRGTWNAMALRGYDVDDPTFIVKPAEMSKKWKAENVDRMSAVSGLTDAAVLAPATMRVVDAIPGRKDRVRFMRLAADGGELSRHADITDREAGVADGSVTRLHIPLRTTTGCKFQSWDARGQCRELHMGQRGLYYLDQRKPHACLNAAVQERIHLVVDTYGSSEIREMIAAEA